MEFMDGLEGLEAIMSMDEQEEDTLALLRRQKGSLLDMRSCSMDRAQTAWIVSAHDP